MVSRKRRLFTIGHSYVVALNRRLAGELARQGGTEWEVVVAAPRRFQGDLGSLTLEHGREKEVLESIDVHCSKWVHVFWYGRVLKDLLSSGWSLVHCWEEPFVVAAAQVANWTPLGTPLVFASFQNLEKHYPPPFAQIERMTVRRASGIVAFGHTVKQTLSVLPAYQAKPMRVIPIGVDIGIFRPDASVRQATLTRLGWGSDGPPIVGFLGRFVPEKGLRILQQALLKVNPAWRALFVGGGVLELELREWASGFGDRVRVATGVRHDEVPEYLNAMDLLCAPSLTTPSWREQFGRMLIEAFACGLPVLGSDSGEIPFTMGDAGEIRPEGATAAWTEAIATLLDSPDRRRRLAAQGRQRAVSEFAWPIVAKRHFEFFEEILAAHR